MVLKVRDLLISLQKRCLIILVPTKFIPNRFIYCRLTHLLKPVVIVIVALLLALL